MQLETIFTERLLSEKAYHVPYRSGLIKLDSMEMPYRFPEELNAALSQVLQLVAINRYPNSRSLDLVARIKKQFNLPEQKEVLLGNGSDELIQMLLMATGKPNAVVMSPVPSFIMYSKMAKMLNMSFIGVDLNADFSIDEKLFVEKMKIHKPVITFLAYPNNPTGYVLSKSFIEKVITTSQGLVVIDEAYGAYTQSTVDDLLAKYENVILMRTFSKIGLAGIRLGYLVGDKSVIAELNKIRMPYNVNALTQVVANFILDHYSFVRDQVTKVLQSRESLLQWLNNQSNIISYPSETNFLLVRVEDANKVFKELRDEYSILVKKLHGSHSVLDNVLRVTIGTEKEIEQFKLALINSIKN